jgi:hypothetical protein
VSRSDDEKIKAVEYKLDGLSRYRVYCIVTSRFRVGDVVASTRAEAEKLGEKLPHYKSMLEQTRRENANLSDDEDQESAVFAEKVERDGE